MNFRTLENDLAEVNAESQEQGFTKEQIAEWNTVAALIVRRIGFEDAHAVRRAADSFGRRIFN